MEPTGPLEDDPNVTDKRYPGNPTRSYRSRDPLRTAGEVTTWRGHPPDEVKAMQDAVKGLERQGVELIDD